MIFNYQTCKDENDMSSGCQHICFIANCGKPLWPPGTIQHSASQS